MLTKTRKGLPASAWAALPLTYVQSRAEGNDGGEAATDAVVNTALSAAGGAAAAAVVGGGIAAAGTLGLIVPPVGVTILVTGGLIFGAYYAQQYTGPVSRFVHDRLVTPMSEDIVELGDNLRDDFWEAMEEFRVGARNFPRDFRDLITG